MIKMLIGAIVVLFVSIPSAYAVQPDEVLEDPVLEARARALSQQLRCVVCQSQHIDDSNAPLAKDMRLLVRERLLAGDTDQEILTYLVNRYGDYVLLKPPVQGNTIVLWAAPLIIFLMAGALAGLYLTNMKRQATNDQEQLGAQESKKQ